MKKLKFLIFPLVASAFGLAACSGGTVNQGPKLNGVNDITCFAYTTVDLLEGVSALDLEDGDITPDLQITITPEAEVENGYAVFPEAGEYDVCYEARDSGGKLARTTAKATVKERDVYMQNPLANGFDLQAGGGVKILNESVNGGIYSFKTSGGELAEDLKLTRTYAFVSGVEYTFVYNFESNLAGKIKIAADGAPFTEKIISAGDNTLEFTYAATDGTAEIGLWLGGLEGDLEITLHSAVKKYFRENNGWTEKLSDFSFDGNVFDRFDGTQGNIGTVDGGKGVYVEITQASADTWRGGVFVNTKLALNAGESYKVSYDVEAENGGPFEVILQNKQWDETKIHTTASAGRHEFDITINGSNSGTLWIYVASGANLNKITLKNLSVQAAESGFSEESFGFGQFTESHAESGTGSMAVENGKVVYKIGSFGSVDWHNKIESPFFTLAGTGSDYVVSFRAKASEPVEVVFAAPTYGGWDPTFAWSKFTVERGERVYSIKSNVDNVARTYCFVWQFGSTVNQRYSDVTVEISDIKICHLSEIDG